MESNRFHPALGSPLAIPADIRAFFYNEGFRPKGTPRPGDWLAQREEGGQSVYDYIESEPNRPDERRQVIYLQPFGAFSDELSPSLEALEEYARAYFSMEVGVLEPLALEAGSITERINPHEGQRQLLTTDILRLLASRLPRDAYCLVGMSMVDLYPDPNWNFVFGQASLRNRVGVYSFARYTEEGDQQLTLLRSLKVMAHEVGHMHGMTHCVFFECALNGSNHLDEADRRPDYLCPVCLRKLHWASDIDPIERYYNLHEFYAQHGFDESAAWMRTRIRRCSN